MKVHNVMWFSSGKGLVGIVAAHGARFPDTAGIAIFGLPQTEEHHGN